MSLTGNLEDLPLLDILQIVSFSKKTGHLSIETPEGEGAIVFRDGFVVSCFTPGTPPLDARSAQLQRPQREALIRGRIEMALERLIRLHEGQFNFSLTDEPPHRIGPRNITHELLEAGINPQELVLDLARGIDEDRRNSSAAIEVAFARPEEDSFEEDLSEGLPGEARLTEIVPSELPASAPALDTTQRLPPPSPATGAEGGEVPRTILLVEDEEDVRSVLGDRFGAAGYNVVEAEDPDAAVKKAQKLKAANVAFMLVTDMGMPTSGGASFQGGFEVIKRLGKMHLRPATLVMTESPNAAAQARARQLGIGQLVFKPGLSKLDPAQFHADLEAFAARVISDILPRLSRAPAPQGSEPARAQPRAPLAPDELTRQFALLQQHLADLRQPSNANQISILIVQAAREFFERGILFLIKSDEARGLGGFGRVSKSEKVNLLVREIVIPLKEPSVFRDVVASGRSFSGPAPEGRWEQYVFAKCGRFKSVDFALIPLLAHRETIAVLFGDNPETGRTLGRLDALEVFVNQAGIALENVFLQRKLEALQRG
jgi:CheY-like chemotaxis protein